MDSNYAMTGTGTWDPLGYTGIMLNKLNTKYYKHTQPFTMSDPSNQRRTNSRNLKAFNTDTKRLEG